MVESTSFLPRTPAGLHALIRTVLRPVDARKTSSRKPGSIGKGWGVDACTTLNTEQHCSGAAFQGTWRKLEARSMNAQTELNGGVKSVSEGTSELGPVSWVSSWSLLPDQEHKDLGHLALQVQDVFCLPTVPCSLTAPRGRPTCKSAARNVCSIEALRHRGYRCREHLCTEGTEVPRLWSTRVSMHRGTEVPRALMQGVPMHRKHQGVEALEHRGQRSTMVSSPKAQMQEASKHRECLSTESAKR
ncbi:UNVERIFIED_CONTAM: hypothetical protein FKN15_027569 [Acipenser sinensis]